MGIGLNDDVFKPEIKRVSNLVKSSSFLRNTYLQKYSSQVNDENSCENGEAQK